MMEREGERGREDPPPKPRKRESFNQTDFSSSSFCLLFFSSSSSPSFDGPGIPNSNNQLGLKKMTAGCSHSY